jgi:hypothetical protein
VNGSGFIRLLAAVRNQTRSRERAKVRSGRVFVGEIAAGLCACWIGGSKTFNPAGDSFGIKRKDAKALRSGAITAHSEMARFYLWPKRQAMAQERAGE